MSRPVLGSWTVTSSSRPLIASLGNWLSTLGTLGSWMVRTGSPFLTLSVTAEALNSPTVTTELTLLCR